MQTKNFGRFRSVLLGIPSESGRKKFPMVSLSLATIVMFVFFSSLANADSRLVIKDNSGTTTFNVEHDGTFWSSGNDGTNNFSLNLESHSGGTKHSQLVTGDQNSRITFMASTSNDFAPRLHMVGPQDVGNFDGGAIFDFGSNLNSLPNASFMVRHYNTTSAAEMFKIIGRNFSVFPNGNVGIGNFTLGSPPSEKLDVQGVVNASGGFTEVSRREAKENIAELKAEDAVEAIKKMKPVKFNYKQFKDEEKVGFIAEDVPDLVATKDRNGLSSMDIVAVLTKVVQEQQKTIDLLNKKMADLESAISREKYSK